MVAVKHQKTGACLGTMQDASYIRMGEYLCDIPNKKTYVVIKKIYDMASGACIGLVVDEPFN